MVQLRYSALNHICTYVIHVHTNRSWYPLCPTPTASLWNSLGSLRVCLLIAVINDVKKVSMKMSQATTDPTTLVLYSHEAAITDDRSMHDKYPILAPSSTHECISYSLLSTSNMYSWLWKRLQMKESVGTLKCACVAILEPRPGGSAYISCPLTYTIPWGVIGKHVHWLCGSADCMVDVRMPSYEYHYPVRSSLLFMTLAHAL